MSEAELAWALENAQPFQKALENRQEQVQCPRCRSWGTAIACTQCQTYLGLICLKHRKTPVEVRSIHYLD